MFQIAPILTRATMAGAGFPAKSPAASAILGASFGAPYAASTYVGFPGNYFSKSKSSNTKTYYMKSSMPYGQRKIRIWSRRLRRYVWVYPSKTYGSRYRRNYSRSYRRY